MKFALLALLAIPAFAQNNITNQWTFTTTTPAGTCNRGQAWVLMPGGTLYTCVNGTPTVNGGGAGTVTSVGLVGTAAQLTVTGTSPITSSGSFTISIPSVLTLPGTINKLTLTAPATAATLTLANNSSLITSGSFAATITSTATTNSTLPAGTHFLAPLDSPTFTGTISAPHYASSSGTPGVAAGGAIGTTPTIAGTDFYGTVTIPSSAVTIGTLFTVTFATAYGSAPNCVVSQNGGVVNIGVGHSQTSSVLTVTAAIANISAAAYSIDYACSGS